MPLQKLELRPGVNRESTSYANEGGFFAGDKIRFRSGYAEKIGGWQSINVNGSTFKGVCRMLWNWITTVGQNLLGLATNQKVYVELGGTYYDITPLGNSLTLSQNPFSVTSGSRLVTVTASAHLSTIGTYVNLSGATAVASLTLNGDYEIQSIPTANTFTIYASATASSTTTGGGSLVIAKFDIDAGLPIYTTTVGWGGPPWGSGGWGSATGAGVPMRLWSMFNYGDDLMFAERNGEIYFWTLDTSTWSRAVTLEEKANTEIKTITTATFASGVTTIVVADATGINTGSVLSGTGIASGTYVTTAWTGTTSLTISAATTSSHTISAVSLSVSYAGQHVPNEVAMIIDSPVNDFVITCGSTPYDPTNFSTTFNPLLVRWSDQGNVYEFVPEVTNQSGEQTLSHGSYIVTAVNTRQEILIWTDTALFSMQYVGPPFVWSFSLLDQDVSIASQNSMLTVNNVVYWMGRDKFFMYSGRVETLPCTLRQFVYNDINYDQLSQVVAGANEGYNEVWWFYPSANSTINDRYVIYNYLERIWYYGNINRSFWSEHSQRNYPLAAFSLDTGFLATAINSSVTTIAMTDTSTYPNSGTVQIDSEKITYAAKSGNTLTGCVRGFDGTTAASHEQYTEVTYIVPNQVMQHEVGNDDQSVTPALPIEAYIETSDFDIQDGQTFGYVWRILPDLNFTGSSASSPTVTLTVKPRQNSGSNYTTADQPTVTRTSVIPIQQYTGQVYTRVRGRQMAFRVDSTELGVAWQMGMMRIDVRPDGRR
jgi:hypothetical protein